MLASARNCKLPASAGRLFQTDAVQQLPKLTPRRLVHLLSFAEFTKLISSRPSRRIVKPDRGFGPLLARCWEVLADLTSAES